MSTLHIVNKPSALEDCLAVAAPEDPVLLIEEGIYAATVALARPLLVLSEDLEVRGLKGRIDAANSIVSYGDFVDLVAAHQPIVTWS